MNTVSSDQFYNELVTDYDSMTRFDQRLQQDRPALERLVNRHGLKSVLDIGCGTGVHSIILANLGVQVTAADPNSEMLNQAKKNAKLHKTQIQFLKSGFLELTDSVSGQFNGIFCLGNSLPHLHSQDELLQTFRIFYQLLLPGGILLIQNLNYDDILKRKPKIVNSRKDGDIEITRSYEYGEQTIRFQVQRIEKSSSKTITTELRPWTREILGTFLRKTEFRDVEFFGGLDLEPYQETGSPNLVILAKK